MDAMRLIDADELPVKTDCNKQYVLYTAIEDAPTIDAVPVVRCKDCKHYKDAPYYAEGCDKICRSPNLDYDTECGDLWMQMNPDDFCSYGERKDGDTQ